MEINIDKKFRDHYGLLLEDFKQRLHNNSIYPEKFSENLPYPFIPDFGKDYEKSGFKIAFIGQDNKYNYEKDLKEFFFHKDPLKFSDILNYDPNDPDEGNRYPEVIDKKFSQGKSFWKFIFKFLLLFYKIDKLYNIDNWKALKDEWEILASFVHGNVNAIPKFAPDFNKCNGLTEENLNKIRKASAIFDNSNHIINVFEPKIILLLHWAELDGWLPKERTEFKVFDSVTLRYCLINETDTHLYQMYHPSYMKQTEKESDMVIFEIIRSVYEKKIFLSFPGQGLVNTQNEIQIQIENIGKELQLEYTVTTNYLGMRESGFYFSKPEWKNFEIGFQFENNGFQGFFYGICKKETKEDFINIELINEPLKSALGAADGSNPECFIWWKWHGKKNWDTETLSQISSGEFSKNIKNQLAEIIEKVKGIEL